METAIDNVISITANAEKAAEKKRKKAERDKKRRAAKKAKPVKKVAAKKSAPKAKKARKTREKLSAVARVGVKVKGFEEKLTRLLDRFGKWPDDETKSISSAQEWLVEAQEKITSAFDALTEVPDDYAPKAKKISRKAIEEGFLVQIAEKKQDQYAVLLDDELDEEADTWTVVAVEGNKLAIQHVVRGTKLIIPRAHVTVVS